MDRAASQHPIRRGGAFMGGGRADHFVPFLSSSTSLPIPVLTIILLVGMSKRSFSEHSWVFLSDTLIQFCQNIKQDRLR